MELFFLIVLVLLMAMALGSGFPVAFALPGSAILAIGLAAVSGYLFVGDVDAYFHSGGPGQWLNAGVTNLRGIYWEVERDTLIAIPLFIFMGIMLQRSKIAEDLLMTMARLFGPVPGGLGISVVFVGALLAATTGIVGATVVAMGLISLPAMLRNNYSQSLATGTIAASGTLGQIIPPSIVLIILADQLASASDQASSARRVLYKAANNDPAMPSVFDVSSTSAGEMFLGALVPGVVLVLLYMAYIFVFAILKPSSAPAVSSDESWNARFWATVTLALVPPLTLIILVLGSILTGVATVNQAGSIGAAGAMIMAGYKLAPPGGRYTYAPAFLAIVSILLIAFVLSTYDMNIKAVFENQSDPTGIYVGVLASLIMLVALLWSGLRVLRTEDTLQHVMIETAKTTSLVFAILLGAAILTSAFRAFGGEDLVRDFLLSLSGGFWVQLIIVMAVIFFLGFFLEFIEIAVVVVPIVAPILLADPSANITAVWLGVLIGLNMQTSFLTPPFGFALFYLRGVAPQSVKTLQIYKGVVAFILLQLLALGIVGYYPKLVNYLPNRVAFLSDSAPPPRNPTLQYCLDSYVIEQIRQDPAQVSQAVGYVSSLDLSFLPAKLAGDLQSSFAEPQLALDALAEIERSEARVNEAKPDYQPLQSIVRNLQNRIRALEDEARVLKREIGFLNDDEQSLRARMENRVVAIETEISALAGDIPSDWEPMHKAFSERVSAEAKARNSFRRSADKAVLPSIEFLERIKTNGDFFALEPELKDLAEAIENEPQNDAELTVKSLLDRVSGLDATGDVRAALSDSRRALRAKSYEPEKAIEALGVAMAAYAVQMNWRRAAETTLSLGLNSYLSELSNTIGARQQPRLSRAQALYLASCNAAHRDLSPYF